MKKSHKAAITELFGQFDQLDQKQRVEIFNLVSKKIQQLVDIDFPTVGIQLIEADKIRSNDYNPNKVAKPEMTLLHHSISKDGLTMPVVVASGDDRGEYEVVDGFHRTSTLKGDTDLMERSHGYIPVSILDKGLDDRISSTVRHNMARGSHQIELTSALVISLTKNNWTDEKLAKELGMDPSEVLRMKQVSGLSDIFGDTSAFSEAWE